MGELVNNPSAKRAVYDHSHAGCVRRMEGNLAKISVTKYIYGGITDNMSVRKKGHMNDQPWLEGFSSDQVQMMEVCQFPYTGDIDKKKVAEVENYLINYLGDKYPHPEVCKNHEKKDKTMAQLGGSGQDFKAGETCIVYVLVV